MELITQIIILATALVGLYKAARIRGFKSRSESQGQNILLNNSSAFSDLFELIGILLFLLAFPAFFWVVKWFVKDILPSDSNSKKAVTIELTENSSASKHMLATAINISNSFNRDESLGKVVSYAIKMKDYQVAIQAASLISSSHIKDEQLNKIIQALSETEEKR